MDYNFSKFSNNVLLDDSFDIFIDMLRKTHFSIQQQAKEHQTRLIGSDQPYLGPKFPITSFQYETVLSEPDTETLSEKELMNEMYTFFQGTTRPQSDLALFNMVPQPINETLVASCIATIYNVNALMDTYGGKSLLIEQKIARTIGRWVEWDQSYGIACNGGKFTMLYAVKAAISRIAPKSQLLGIPNNLVVLVNEGGHYCVEHVCSILGIGTKNCLRVPVNAEGKMDTQVLEQLMRTQIEKNNKIAAIICCGGTTINFCCDDTTEISQLVTRFTKEHNLDYYPYLHLDSVIGWLYFTLLKKSEKQIQNLPIEPSIQNKFIEIRKRFLGLAAFDSFGVDFHKNGLCPYSSSFFVSKTADCFNLLNQGDYTYETKDMEFEQFRAYRYTFENSRPSQGILSSWIMLKKIGIEGLLKYLIKLHEVQYCIIKKMNEYNIFNVLNTFSAGWEIVFSIDFELLSSSQKENFDAHKVALAFMQRCWDKVNRGETFPLFSIVPDYKIKNDPMKKTTAFLIYPMHTELNSERITDILDDIKKEVILFEKEVINDIKSLNNRILEKPIR